jgi:hypothetical protein
MLGVIFCTFNFVKCLLSFVMYSFTHLKELENKGTVSQDFHLQFILLKVPPGLLFTLLEDFRFF